VVPKWFKKVWSEPYGNFLYISFLCAKATKTTVSSLIITPIL
jgi:hypothetical protein